MFLKYILNPFIESAIKFSSHNAFCINDKFYTYKELLNAISTIRIVLEKEDLKSKNIGLVANDDIETYASIFAIWMLGYAYVPLHPHQPVERNIEIITQSDIELVIDSKAESEYSDYHVICSSLLPDTEINNILKEVPEDALAYILYTSGSTGKPKGVKISRKNLGSFMKAFWEIGFSISNNDRCLQCFDLTFDVSVQSYLVPLIKGACAYTIPHDAIKYSYVYGLFEDHKLTFGAMAPSMLRYLRPYFSEIRVPSMRYNILTAEASPVDLIAEWADCIPNSEIFDLYGPTEGTIYCTYNKFLRGHVNKQLNGMLSIGKPMNGISAVIIDERNKILLNNQQGELCVSGNQITGGYWNDDQKNATAFVDLLIRGVSMRFYRTGDSCYFDDEGDILLAGRLDHQVKIQGYRIELGEIEFHARECLPGQNAVALTWFNDNNPGIALLIEGGIADENYLREFLKKKMPDYMIPSKIMAIDHFPLNSSGKVDRIKLKEFV